MARQVLAGLAVIGLAASAIAWLTSWATPVSLALVAVAFLMTSLPAAVRRRTRRDDERVPTSIDRAVDAAVGAALIIAAVGSASLGVRTLHGAVTRLGIADGLVALALAVVIVLSTSQRVGRLVRSLLAFPALERQAWEAVIRMGRISVVEPPVAGFFGRGEWGNPAVRVVVRPEAPGPDEIATHEVQLRRELPAGTRVVVVDEAAQF